MILLVICFGLITAGELVMSAYLNKHVPDFAMNPKKFAIVLSVGNLALAALSFYKNSRFGDDAVPAYWFFCLLAYLYCMMLYDLKHKLLPDWLHLIPLIGYAGVWIQQKQPVPLLQSVVTVVLTAVMLGLIILIQKDAIGTGDVKLLLVCSIYTGYYCMGIVFRGCVVAFAISIVMLLMKKVSRKSELPFAPFLFLGALLL